MMVLESRHRLSCRGAIDVVKVKMPEIRAFYSDSVPRFDSRIGPSEDLGDDGDDRA